MSDIARRSIRITMRLGIAVLVGVAVLAWLVIGTPDPPDEPRLSDTARVADDDQDQSRPTAAIAVADEAPERSESPVVVFPNGNTYEIALRPEPRLSLPAGLTAAEYFLQLKIQAMGGDGAAANRIYGLLRGCASAYRNPVALEAAVNEMYATRVRPPGPGEQIANPELIDNDRSLEDIEGQLRGHSASCADISDADINSAEGWLKLGVELDDVDSLMNYANVTSFDSYEDGVRPAYSTAGVEILERAWKQGRVHALHELSEIYSAGSESIQPDRVKASAYLYLNTHLRVIQIERRDPMPEGFPAQDLIDGKTEFLEQQMLQLRPFEVDAALEMAEDLLRNNPDCCFDYF
jgi:hypothetical protein